MSATVGTTASAVKPSTSAVTTATTLSEPRYREKATYEEELRKPSHDTYLLSESMLRWEVINLLIG